MYDRCFNGNSGVFCGFRAVFGVERADCAVGVLVVVFHTGLWQPWRASIFSVLLGSVALSLTPAEDCRGLQAFSNKSPFYLLFLSYYFCILLILLESDKTLGQSERETNSSFIGNHLYQR